MDDHNPHVDPNALDRTFGLIPATIITVVLAMMLLYRLMAAIYGLLF